MTTIPNHACRHCTGRHGCLVCGYAEDDHADATFLDRAIAATLPDLGDSPPDTMICGPEPRKGEICTR